MSQNPVLLSGSVKYNIAYGLRDCTIERVQEAAKKANAHDFICRLDKGYDTGENFSLLPDSSFNRYVKKKKSI